MSRESFINWNEYDIYEDGRIYSKYWKKSLMGYVQKNGYVQVGLKCVDGTKKLFRFHRVIWTYFNGAIPEGYEINHIDENKKNNALSNLNLMTHTENCNWGTGIQRSSEKQRGKHLSEETKSKIGKALSKPVVAVDKDGNVVKRFSSTKEAQRNGFNSGHVSNCCKGKEKTCGGYGWRYA